MILHQDITKGIIGAAMRVHTALGNGFQEVIYQRCLEIELRNLGLSFEREKNQNIFYEGIALGTRRVDFFVEEKILIELKAITQL